MAQTQDEKTHPFNILFYDFLQSLHETFPTCKPTYDLLKQVQQDAKVLDTIRFAWKTAIVPYHIQSFKWVGHYFLRIRKDVSSQHPFNTLKLLEKFESLKIDSDSQNEFCSLLRDLETVLDNSEQSKSQPSLHARSRFEDPQLRAMCIEAIGATLENVKLIDELHALCRDNADLNQMYESKTNEQIAQETKQMKFVLPMFIQLVKSKTLSIPTISKFMQRKIKKK